jgi:hypothetical protein
VDQHHRIFGRDRVKFGQRRVAAFGQRRLVPAKAHDDSGRFHRLFVLGHPVADGLLQGRDIRHIAVRRSKDIGGQRLHSADEDMAVRIEKAGQQCPTVQFGDFGALALQDHDFVNAADRDDQAILYRHRLGAGLRVVHRQDRATDEYTVGHVLRHRGRCGT